jgi:transcription termination factor Rho
MDSKKDANPATEGLPFGALERPAKPAGALAERKTAGEAQRRERPEPAPRQSDAPAGGGPPSAVEAPAPERFERQGEGDGEGGRRRWQKRRRGRRGRRGGGGGPGTGAPHGAVPAQESRSDERREGEFRREQRPQVRQGPERREVEGMVILEHANHGRLRSLDGLLPSKNDVHIPPRLVQTFQLREGAIVKGVFGRGQGKNKYDLIEVHEVDGLDPREARALPSFKRLTSIDPDFHYAMGDGSGDTSLRIVDLICPIGRGQRGLIVAPPRSGKTILLQKIAHAIEEIYPEVELIVLLVDERPEEATEWRRTVQRGRVFVSTNDELHKNHVELCEAVWMLCRRRVELGKDVVLLLDSITRMGRAYNNVYGNSGKTMSGGLDTRALERPKQFFGSARNSESAGSLTILGTCLVETGSVMDKVIFEEFKGTGNMELVLSRKLADRRIFPAIDIEKSGTRKEEKLISAQRLKWITTLRRVLQRMHFAEALELLITKLDNVERTDDFLKRFEIDPEA